MKSINYSYLIIIFFTDHERELKCCDGDIRLLDGRALNEGRVEVCHSGRWKTVCDNSWSEREAKVVCKQLGYSDQGNKN